VSKGGGNNLNYQSKSLSGMDFFYIDEFDNSQLKGFLPL